VKKKAKAKAAAGLPAKHVAKAIAGAGKAESNVEKVAVGLPAKHAAKAIAEAGKAEGSVKARHTTRGNIAEFFNRTAAGASSSASASTQASSVLQAISSKLDALVKGPSLEVAMPELSLCTTFAQWRHPDAMKLRGTCPFPGKVDFLKFNLSEFETYLLMNTSMKDSDTRGYCLMNLKRFLNAINVPDDSDYLGVMCGIYKQGVLQKVAACPAMDVRYGWAREIYAALLHFATFCIAVANRRGHHVAKSLIQSLVDETLTPMNKRATSAKKTGAVHKKMMDSARMEYYPSAEQIKVEVRRAMARIAVIRDHCVAEGLLVDMPYALRLEAVTSMIGIIFFNSFAGRSGEWTVMKREYVEEQIRKGSTYLVCDLHKTSLVYGSIAKHVPEGSMAAMEAFCSLPGKHTDKFLEPPTIGCDKVNVAGLLKRFGCRAFGHEDPPNSNLIRKHFHTHLLRMSRGTDAMQFMTKIDGHSEKVARQVYVIMTAEDDANLARLLFSEVCGDPVSFPTPDEIASMNVTIDGITADGDAIACEQIEEATENEDQYTLYVPILDVPNTPPFDADPSFVPLPLLNEPWCSCT